MSHFLFMVLHAFLLGVFFAFLWHDNPKEQLITFAKIFFGLVLGGIALAWIMYYLPSAPPPPFS